MLVVNASDRALLYCDANIPLLLLNVTWRFMNDELPESIIVSDNGTLTIESTSKEHTGTYSCTVYHRTRAVTAEAAVIVQCMFCTHMLECFFVYIMIVAN